MNLYGIFGAGSYGRETIPILNQQIKQECGSDYALVFVDDVLAGKKVNGFEVLSTNCFLKAPYLKKYFNVAIANDKIRQRVSKSILLHGVEPITIKHPNSVVYDHTMIGSGAIISPFVTISTNTHIGRFFHANIYSYVAHDCQIGDYVTFAPGAKCNGYVVIEDNAYIGSGAVIKQGVPNRPLIIGAGAIIGMGAVVTKSVPAGITVCGNPAREMKRSPTSI
ncbi:GDP-perosamine N-acetyltransferase [Escherichia coli]|nr:GDP-perosamine N-acetyltransferase [Escherichia coli]EER0458546.1 GDP-perosamine N-acetyltransferase [Escherichia coli]